MEIEQRSLQKEWALHRRLPLALAAITFVGLLLVTLAIGPSYETSDDPAMALMSAGVQATATPTPLLVFINVIVGELLQWLSTQAPHVPWYAWLQFVPLWLAAGAWTAMLVSLGGRRGLVGAVVIGGGIFLPCSLFLQFTKTGAVVAFSGWVLMSYGIRRGAFGAVALSIAAIVYGFLMRWDAGVLATALASPLVLRELVLAANKKRLMYAGAFVAVGTLLTGAKLIDEAAYTSDSRWADYFVLNRNKCEFIDWLHVDYNDATKEIFDAEGWSANDYWLMRSWLYWDTDTYSSAKMKAISDRAIAKVGLPPRPLSGLWEVVRDNQLFFMLIGLVAIFSLDLMRRGSKETRAALIASFAGTVLTFGYLYYFRYLPERVYITLAYGLVFTSVHLSTVDQETLKNRAVDRYEALFFATILVIGTLYTANRVTDTRRIQEAAARFYTKLDPSPDEIFLVLLPPYSLEYFTSPLDDPQKLRDWHTVSIGWPLRSPLMRDYLDSLALGDIFDAMANDPRVRLMIAPKLQPLVVNYFAEHRGQRIEFRPTDRPFVWKLVVLGATPQPGNRNLKATTAQ